MKSDKTSTPPSTQSAEASNEGVGSKEETPITPAALSNTSSPSLVRLSPVYAYLITAAGLMLIIGGAVVIGVCVAVGGMVANIFMRAKSARSRAHQGGTGTLPPRPEHSNEGSPSTEGESSGNLRSGRHVRRISRNRALVELAVIVAVAILGMLAIQAWLIKPYEVPSYSMEPTLEAGQRINVNRFIYHFQDPEIGDIIVFHPPLGAEDTPGGRCGVTKEGEEPCPRPTSEQASENFVKRIVAGPGDRISIRDGHAVVNGQALTEPYIEPCGGAYGCTLPESITIPPDHYFMMGDNRGGSNDSRSWGPVPRDWIIGKVFSTYWPPDRWGFI